ncbi:Txe/YoeB family addiction module toxin [Lacticaseibacillus zhaodongensis]|uniref:Txe/YoeB family addiction module toxin n=1 Tax=Lacticaseibacillus zhaodongensis TaxID=2668065 RepID=UPI0018AF7BDF|nr:Txe/YoeB family addiction module toxin [Lacticaseibacillus zhaodongensis]
MYTVNISKTADRDLRRESQMSVRKKIERVIAILAENPFQAPPRYEKLAEDVDLYSRRVNVQHRVVYKVDKERRLVHVLAVRSHYE